MSMVALFWEETLKTCIARDTTSARNWSASVLLDEEGRRHDSRHFHQLLRHLRLTENRAKRTGWTQDLGHFDHLLWDGGVEEFWI